ncbi:hypothetical protein L218DRAFT_936223 [Marasmius fiardii PR-910]|nr:hypothetical protein L218DRAFT_936223 [Marasmius fiardii PR-910]
MLSLSSFFSPQKEVFYTQLPSDTSPSELPSASWKKGSSWFNLFAIGICVLCTLINISLLGVRPRSPLLSHTANGLYTRRQIDSLRRPSQFIGLQTVHRATQLPSLSTTVYAHVISPIDKDKPSTVSGNDPKSYYSPNGLGTISPEDRQVKVSRTASTIMQFRATDFGMEICELHISIPDNTSTPFLELPNVPLDIYFLDQPKMLYPDSLSYATRPPRKQLLTRVRLENEMEWSHRFGCTMDELLTFEIACPPRPIGQSISCEMSWWQNRENPSPGVFFFFNNKTE